MPDIIITSHRGPYRVRFGKPFEGLEKGLSPKEHLLIDSKVAELYATALGPALAGRSVIRIEAAETNKSLERLPTYVTRLLEAGIQRDHTLIAIGGGIVQDITAFIAATLLRGLKWRYFPTTLLAQADSCVGSKSSLNVGRFKNQLGTFTPPDEILISTAVLDTLSDEDLRSGLGEIIKVHIISGEEDTRRLLRDYPALRLDRAALERTILRSLEIKKCLIELDEFDQNERLVLNYGHTFGHAIESATDYRIPHGIAVTLGMDMANRLSQSLGYFEGKAWEGIGLMLAKNHAGFEATDIPKEKFFAALSRDKKNAGQDIRFVLLSGPGRMFLEGRPLDASLESFCRNFFAELRSQTAGVRP